VGLLAGYDRPRVRIAPRVRIRSQRRRHFDADTRRDVVADDRGGGLRHDAAIEVGQWDEPSAHGGGHKTDDDDDEPCGEYLPQVAAA
jgi:hypothetical protein